MKGTKLSQISRICSIKKEGTEYAPFLPLNNGNTLLLFFDEALNERGLGIGTPQQVYSRLKRRNIHTFLRALQSTPLNKTAVQIHNLNLCFIEIFRHRYIKTVISRIRINFEIAFRLSEKRFQNLS